MNTKNAMLVRYATTASTTSVTSTCPLALRERTIKNTRTNNRRSTAYTIETNAMNTSRRRVTGGDQRAGAGDCPAMLLSRKPSITSVTPKKMA